MNYLQKAYNTKHKLLYPKKMFGYIADAIVRDSALPAFIFGFIFG